MSQTFFTYGLFFFYGHNCAYRIIKAVVGTLICSPHQPGPSTLPNLRVYISFTPLTEPLSSIMIERCWICRILMASSSFVFLSFFFFWKPQVCLFDRICCSNTPENSDPSAVSVIYDTRAWSQNTTSMPHPSPNTNSDESFIRQNNGCETTFQAWGDEITAMVEETEARKHVYMCWQNKTKHAEQRSSEWSKADADHGPQSISLLTEKSHHMKALAETPARPRQRQENHFGHWGHISAAAWNPLTCLLEIFACCYRKR